MEVISPWGKLYKSKLQLRKSKEILYSSFLRLVLAYAYETWLKNFTKEGEENTLIFMRKVPTGTMIEINGIYWIKTDKEVQEIDIKPNTSISTYLMSKKIKYVGHIWRSSDIIKKSHDRENKWEKTKKPAEITLDKQNLRKSEQVWERIKNRRQ